MADNMPVMLSHEGIRGVGPEYAPGPTGVARQSRQGLVVVVIGVGERRRLGAEANERGGWGLRDDRFVKKEVILLPQVIDLVRRSPDYLLGVL